MTELPDGFEIQTSEETLDEPHEEMQTCVNCGTQQSRVVSKGKNKGLCDFCVHDKK